MQASALRQGQEMSELLGERYRALYQNYYSDGAVATKRSISAVDALAHIKAAVGSDSFDRVVDVGAGEGSLLEILDHSGFARELYALEISQAGAQAIEARGPWALLSAPRASTATRFLTRINSSTWPFSATSLSTSSTNESYCANCAALRATS